MYKKLFDLYTGQHTTLDLDTAEALWGVYLKEKFKFYDKWMAYLNSLEEKQTKKVHKDLWFMVWDFCYEIQEIEKYSEDDGWPTFIDNFVEYVKNSWSVFWINTCFMKVVFFYCILFVAFIWATVQDDKNATVPPVSHLASPHFQNDCDWVCGVL